jgi:ABC-type antimicrobial peptide transport system ATPase subunit
MTASPLIEIEGLRVTFHGDDGRLTHAVDRVDLSVANGATLGLVGESGCGRGLRFFLWCCRSTWSATACATRSIRANADRGD